MSSERLSDVTDLRLDYEQNRTRPEVISAAGVITFSVAAAVLFVAAMLAYVIAWFNKNTVLDMPQLPWIFWISTPVVLLSSLFLEYAIKSARARHGVAGHRALLTATGLCFFFIGLQSPGLVMLGQMQLSFRAASPALYALTFVLIGLHLLHAIGAVVVLSAASLRSEERHYEGDEGAQLRPLAIYCHFVAVAWMLMFSMLLLLNK